MQVTKLLRSDDERAVSPVIGVILMVAITVILAAVIGTFVLGLGDQVQTTAPNTQFSFDYTDGESLDITHDGGDGIHNSELSVVVNGETFDAENEPSGSTWPTGVVSAGTTITLDSNDVSPEDNVRVVWTSPDGSSSSTVASWSGPDA